MFLYGLVIPSLSPYGMNRRDFLDSLAVPSLWPVRTPYPTRRVSDRFVQTGKEQNTDPHKTALNEYSCYTLVFPHRILFFEIDTSDIPSWSVSEQISHLLYPGEAQSLSDFLLQSASSAMMAAAAALLFVCHQLTPSEISGVNGLLHQSNWRATVWKTL
jgi:hypothetical protein